MLYFLVFYLGVIVGVFIMALCFSSSIQNRKEEIEEEFIRKNSCEVAKWKNINNNRKENNIRKE